MTKQQDSGPTELGYEPFTYTDIQGIEISVYAWLPDASRHPEPLGAVQIAHGIGEHALRYDSFARHLASAGLAVYADDHRGHGETGRRQHAGDLSQLGKLGPGGLRATEDAIVQLTGIIRERHPGISVAQFGHSWGSLMTQRILNTNPRLWDAVVLSGSALRTMRHMESGKLNAAWNTPDAHGFEWLSRDPETAKKFLADPLCFEANIAQLFGLPDALRLFGKPAAGLASDVPVLIVSGSEDPLKKGNSLQLLAEAYRARGVRDVALKIYPEARHELLNETNRDEVYADLTTWLLERLSS